MNIENQERYFFCASAEDFKKIPGSPIAYWVSEKIGNAFFENKPIERHFPVNPGIRTGKDIWFLRLWFEVVFNHTQFGLHNSTQMNPAIKWFPLHKGGSFRKWYGNAEHVIDLEYGGQNIIMNSPDFRLREKKWYFKPFVSWSRISSADIAFRYFPCGVLFSDAGPGIFAEDKCLEVIALLNSKLGNLFLNIINPTLNYQKQDVESVPFASLGNQSNVSNFVMYEKNDWDSYETSWDFTTLPLLTPNDVLKTPVSEQLPTSHFPFSTKLSQAYAQLRSHWQQTTLEMQRLEEENNRIFIDAYGLQDELTPEVPLNEITLTCNPFYRYGKKVESVKQEVESDGQKTFPLDPDLEERLRADTLKEFISYAVGCMFGRYSLDAPGLILANQGEGVADFVRKVESAKCEVESNNKSISTSHCISFMPDEDNVIPILDDNWFTDDIVERFQRFLKVTFGEEHYEENLNFIEKAIGKSLRKYFLKDFYLDHVKRYKKRPIYWLFSSSKGSFNALIYMHRYRPDTVSVILNDYLREFRTKLTARKEHLEKVSISASADNREKTAALKEIDKLTKTIDELNDYEAVLYDLATRNIEIDLDDGVKANYPKFGKALKKIAGLS